MSARVQDACDDQGLVGPKDVDLKKNDLDAVKDSHSKSSSKGKADPASFETSGKDGETTKKGKKGGRPKFERASLMDLFKYSTCC